MMDLQTVITVLISSISLIGLAVGYSWFYLDYRVDLFRQKMFALRDEVFDLGRRGVVPFDQKAYGQLRNTINGFIRFGHRVGFFSQVFYQWRMRQEDQEFSASFAESWERNTARLDPHARSELNKMVLKMHIVIVEQMIFTSPILTLTLVPVTVWFVLHRVQELVLDWFDKYWLDRMDSAAFAVGRIN
jgi:hypothetical protein